MGQWPLVCINGRPTPKNRYFVSIEVFYSKSVFYSATVLELYNEDLGKITALFYKMQF
jgi:hypothetical protein